MKVYTVKSVRGKEHGLLETLRFKYKQSQSDFEILDKFSE